MKKVVTFKFPQDGRLSLVENKSKFIRNAVLKALDEKGISDSNGAVLFRTEKGDVLYKPTSDDYGSFLIDTQHHGQTTTIDWYSSISDFFDWTSGIPGYENLVSMLAIDDERFNKWIVFQIESGRKRALQAKKKKTRASLRREANAL